MSLTSTTAVTLPSAGWPPDVCTKLKRNAAWAKPLQKWKHSQVAGRGNAKVVLGRAFSQAWTHLRQGGLLGVSCQSRVSQSRTKLMLCDLDAEVRMTSGLESGRNVPPVGDVLGVELDEQVNLILTLWVYGYLIHRWLQDSSLQCLRAE